jgi:hypothetical protein
MLLKSGKPLVDESSTLSQLRIGEADSLHCAIRKTIVLPSRDEDVKEDESNPNENEPVMLEVHRVGRDGSISVEIEPDQLGDALIRKVFAQPTAFSPHCFCVPKRFVHSGSAI